MTVATTACARALCSTLIDFQHGLIEFVGYLVAKLAVSTSTPLLSLHHLLANFPLKRSTDPSVLTLQAGCRSKQAKSALGGSMS